MKLFAITFELEHVDTCVVLAKDIETAKDLLISSLKTQYPFYFKDGTVPILSCDEVDMSEPKAFTFNAGIYF